MIGKILIAVGAFFVYLGISMELLNLMSSKTHLYWLGVIGILLLGLLYYKLLDFLFKPKKQTKNEQKSDLDS